MHSDNSRGEDGERRNHRSLTAIAYANQDWTEDDKGSLRLWLNSDELDPHSYSDNDSTREVWDCCHAALCLRVFYGFDPRG